MTGTSKRMTQVAATTALLYLTPAMAAAHGPIFSFSPHTEFKGAAAYELGYERHEVAGHAENEYELGFHYGVTSDLTAKVELPYVRSEEADTAGDPHLKAKYRFHRATQGPSLTSWTVLGGARPDTSDDDESPGSAFAAFAYGFESLTWYRWASVGVRGHAENDAGVRAGETVEINVAGGWRPRKAVYGEPDLVFLTELNAQTQGRAQRGGTDLDDTGGTEAFLSPGFIWTYGRHFSLRPGFQIPVYSDLTGDQAATDFRARIAIEMHF
jgi:hypothetical protein